MNLDGPVRVADTAGSGTATVTLSFDAWKEAKVAPTTHSVPVLPAKAATKAEAVAESLVGTLTHPDRKASVATVKFSDDGKRLFVTGYPSGIVQVFDVATRRELRRVDTPAGLRGSSNYALLSPDWKTMYVYVEKRVPKPIEKDGKKLYRIEYSGSIRVWSLTTGEEQAPLKPPEGSAPVAAKLSPDGNSLFCVERPSYDSDATDVKDTTVVWDLKTGDRRVVTEGFAYPAFAPDGKTFALQVSDRQVKKDTIRILDVTTFRELARVECPDQDRHFAIGQFSPDGSVLAISIGGKKGAAPELWFRDAKTLEDRGRFVGEADENGWGWASGHFTPDGKQYLITGSGTKVVAWDVAGKKAARTFDVGTTSRQLAVSHDGKTLAVAWMPKSDLDEERVRDPDPRDLPQPRVTLFDLGGKAPPRTLVAPHGYAGTLAFSPDGRTLAMGSSGGVRMFDLTK